LTFDDGPILPYSNQILDILASQCVKATYFLVGEMARAFPPGCAAFTRKDTRSARTASTIRPGSANCRSRECVMRSTEAFPTSAPHWAIPNISHRSSVFPVWRDPMSSKANSQARGLSVFSSDTDADDWHHRISGQQIIALAMRRLEARGKGILLLHDIHPATVAALPGLLKELKDKGFHIVQVVPAASYVIAMANKPKTQSLASTLPGEPMIGEDRNSGARPHWPHVLTNVAPDDSVLPVPDASSFEPDAVTSENITDVHWPAPPAKTQAPAPRKHKFAGRETPSITICFYALLGYTGPCIKCQRPPQ